MPDRRRTHDRRVARRRDHDPIAKPSKPLWTLKEVAAYLGVSERWLRGARDEIPRALVAGQLRFRPSQIRQMVLDQTETSQSSSTVDLSQILDELEVS